MISYFNKLKYKYNLEVGAIPKTKATTADGKFSFYDWGEDYKPENDWFVRFAKHNLLSIDKKLNFYGVYGKGRFVRNKVEGKKIFFSPENLDKKFMKWNILFGDYCLPYVDLGMGFGDIKKDNYLRFPLWILYLFSPEANKKDVESTIDKINNTRYQKLKICALIAGHDKHGTRKMLLDGIKDVIPVDCAGKWENNTEDLWNKYNNDKIEYLKQFKFNICPENINTKNYVSEKLFEAFVADTIPIYYGSDNDPEPGLINKDAVVFWYKNSSNDKARKLIKELCVDDNAYSDFIKQKKILPAATDYIWSRYEELKQRLEVMNK